MQILRQLGRGHLGTADDRAHQVERERFAAALYGDGHPGACRAAQQLGQFLKRQSADRGAVDLFEPVSRLHPGIRRRRVGRDRIDHIAPVCLPHDHADPGIARDRGIAIAVAHGCKIHRVAVHADEIAVHDLIQPVGLGLEQAAGLQDLGLGDGGGLRDQTFPVDRLRRLPEPHRRLCPVQRKHRTDSKRQC